MSRGRLRLLLGALLAASLQAGCAATGASTPAAAAGASPLRYTVRFDPGGTLDVEVAGFAPAERAWRTSRRGRARDFEARVGERWTPLPADGSGQVTLPAGARGLRYVYDLAGSDLTAGAGQDGGYLVDGRAYLLRPDEVRSRREAALTFLGPGPLLVPWELEDAPGGGRTARVQGRDLWSPGFHTFGVEPERIELPGGTIELAVLPAGRRPPQALVRRWIEQAGREVLTARSRFPHRRVAVTLVPVASREPSPFGKVLLSRPPSVALYVGDQATARDFASDWVAVHEMFHVIEPRVRPEETWLTEGIATYYQGLARLRSGRRDAEAVWDSFCGGVARGRRQAGDRPLIELSERMRELHCYQAVYWGGALFALELDLELRRRTGGRECLDTVLAALFEPESSVSLERFAEQVDAAAGEPLFEELSALHLRGPALRRAPALLRRLGLAGDAGASSPELAALRESPIAGAW